MKILAASLLLSSAILLLAVPSLRAQSVIGMTKEEVRAMVQENHKEFRPDRLVVNQSFNYLKYVNGLRTRTWIFYFTDRDLCRSVKLVCDYGEYDEVLEDLNKSYDQAGESRWTYLLNSDTIQLTLTRQEWYFTVREARKN